MEDFKKRIAQHIEHIKKVGKHCTTEETTKQALILPLLDALGFNPYNPMRVKAEYHADFPGVKASERVDYALFSADIPVIFIEAKAYSEELTNHCPQLSRYFNATPEVTVSAITNGREWRFFTDLDNRNIMDKDPFLVINFLEPDEDVAEQLMRFHHDQLEPEALRALAEENIYLTTFKETITAALRDCDLDFVRYIASKAGIQRTLTGRFLEGVQPIAKQAVAQSISSLVATSLSPHAKVTLDDDAKGHEDKQEEEGTDDKLPIVDPLNPKIITTYDERKLYEICCDILPGEDLQARDTETYYSILYEGKTNRWLFRYWGDRRRSTVQFIEPLTNEHIREIERAGLEVSASGQIFLEKPENLYRIAGLVRDALEYCKDDDNFRRSSRQGANSEQQ